MDNLFENNLVSFLVGLLLIIFTFIIVVNFWKVLLLIFSGMVIAFVCIFLGRLVINYIKSIL
jgi:hypothetical protein